ncbi:thiamine diphosphokinase [Macrococcoides canis]|uniref:thiamine diphosphokinase n=1 Tax=Macrococcoides canis TaxID=1855823 RepID=UPI001AEC5AA3|nr:thiamine diphosphokinase [Macrococcus canis]QTQ09111.1 thiamine diphosphokinase [Macrococcus canis]QUR93663.1 thiamine diphosphokinase [Macrococcus canis]UTH03379.1 thiamine diphosphokinase [Macrococcus canis]UTH07811.1 thiamine diphosphokinase [Macrococcus canis]
MNLHILCTQLEVDDSIFEVYRDDDWIGVDFGTLMLVDHNIRPIAAFGDFDSIDAAQKLRIESVIDIDYLPAEKNETDLEVAIQYAKDLGYDKVFIHGATGGRLDHFLGNLQTLLHPEILLSTSEFYIVNAQNTIHVLTAGTHILEHETDKRYVSFIPVNDGVILSLEGFKYNTERLEINLGITRTVSNEFVDHRAQVTVEQGMVYCIQSKEQ